MSQTIARKPTFGLSLNTPTTVFKPSKPKSSTTTRDRQIALDLNENLGVKFSSEQKKNSETRNWNSFTPTREQKLINDAVERVISKRLSGSVILVNAGAGSGKTTTAAYICNVALRGQPVAYIAFNKSVAADATRSGKFPNTVSAKTMHAFALAGLGCQFAFDDQLKSGGLIQFLGTENWPGVVGISPWDQQKIVFAALTNYFQSADKDINDSHINAALDDLVYRIPDNVKDPNEHKAQMTKRANAHRLCSAVCAKIAMKLFKSIKDGKALSFDSYLKYLSLSPKDIQNTFGKFSFLIMDEAQDWNPVMREIAIKSGCNLLVIGDTHQSIYSWRGSDSALDHFHKGEQFFLSESFRFGPSVAKCAMLVLNAVPDKSRRPKFVLKGMAKHQTVVELCDRVEAPTIICRTNMGVIQAAIGCAKRGHRVHVKGSLEAITQVIESAVALRDGRTKDIKSDLIKRFPSWAALKVEAKAGSDKEIEAIVKNVEDESFLRNLSLVRSKESNEASADFNILTAHKSKGGEWDVVGLADDFPNWASLQKRWDAASKTGNKAKLQAVIEEYNCLYVAVTRARKILRIPNTHHDWLEHEGVVKCI